MFTITHQLKAHHRENVMNQSAYYECVANKFKGETRLRALRAAVSHLPVHSRTYLRDYKRIHAKIVDDLQGTLHPVVK